MTKDQLNFAWVCLLILFLSGCSTKNETKTESESEAKSETDSGVISFSSVPEDGSLSMFDYFQKIEIIPLETVDESILKPPFFRMVVYNDLLMFMDQDRSSIHIFDHHGRFIKRFDRNGQGPGDYINMSDFQINRFTGNLEIICQIRGLCIYNQDGNFIERISLYDQIYPLNYFISLTPDIDIHYVGGRKGEKMSFYSRSERKVIHKAYDIDEYYHKNTSHKEITNPFYCYNDTICFVQAYNGQVFQINSDFTLQERYKWDFGESNFDLSKIEKGKDIMYHYLNSEKENGNFAVKFIANGENHDYVSTYFRWRKKRLTLLLDKKNGEIKILSKFQEGFQAIPFVVNDDAMYWFMTVAEFNTHIDISKLDETHQQLAQCIDEEDNPIILKLSFKK